ncbi:hypothetical protein IMY05_007G0076500 [Salix suchowensis]|nr:hypothetical protein IMY05_007G0076500 [Salix suchowensis]
MMHSINAAPCTLVVKKVENISVIFLPCKHMDQNLQDASQCGVVEHILPSTTLAYHDLSDLEKAINPSFWDFVKT